MFEKLPLDESMTIFIFLEFCLSNENDFFIFSMYEFRAFESTNIRPILFPIISVESELSRPSIISSISSSSASVSFSPSLLKIFIPYEMQKS